MSAVLSRRNALALGAAALSTPLAAPAIAQGNARVIRFVPSANLSSLDPLWSTALISFDAAYLYADQLFGLNNQLIPQPQMLEGYELSPDHLTWRMKLREGLLFHTGEPVLARDAVASIRRWMGRDLFGKRMASQLNEMAVLDDRSFEIRLKKPFALLPYGLGATACFIMPARIVEKSDAFTQIKEAVGSGPYRFVAEDWDMSTRATFVRFDKYVPRPEKAEFWSGGKVAHLDRVEWQIIPDAATAAQALMKAEVDWIERPQFDLLPQLRKAPGVKLEVVDPLGTWAEIYFNNAVPPFDNPKLRRALFPAVAQSDYMQALFGDQTEFFRTGIGPFHPASPYANQVGMSALTGPRSLDEARRLVKESGYAGEQIVQMLPTDQVAGNAYGQVTNQMLRQVGLNVRLDAMDWGTLLSRWNAKENSAQGTWNVFAVGWSGLWITNPGSHLPLHYHKANPKMEALTDEWFDAPDLAAQKAVCERIQALAFDDPPFIPIGQYFAPHAHRDNIVDIVHAPMSQFWNVKKA